MTEPSPGDSGPSLSSSGSVLQSLPWLVLTHWGSLSPLWSAGEWVGVPGPGRVGVCPVWKFSTLLCWLHCSLSACLPPTLSLLGVSLASYWRGWTPASLPACRSMPRGGLWQLLLLFLPFLGLFSIVFLLLLSLFMAWVSAPLAWLSQTLLGSGQPSSPTGHTVCHPSLLILLGFQLPGGSRALDI